MTTTRRESQSSPFSEVSERGFHGRGDEEMTASREELKFFVPQGKEAALVRAIENHLPRHRYEGAGANRLPHPQHFVTTVYFDTKGKEYFRRAASCPRRHLKLRLKDYYDRHPALAPVVSRSRDLIRSQPWVWLEVKRREQERTMKDRWRIERLSLPNLMAGLRGETGLPLTLDDALAGFLVDISGPIEPSVVVNYRRLSWQDAEGTLRLTLDVDVAFFSPERLAILHDESLVRSRLGRPLGGLGSSVLEVKLRGPLPNWLADILHELSISEARISKFRAGNEAILRGVA